MITLPRSVCKSVLSIALLDTLQNYASDYLLASELYVCQNPYNDPRNERVDLHWRHLARPRVSPNPTVAHPLAPNTHQHLLRVRALPPHRAILTRANRQTPHHPHRHRHRNPHRHVLPPHLHRLLLDAPPADPLG